MPRQGSRRRALRRWLSLAVSAGVMAAIAITPASANLPGSTFEGSDGNLTVDHPGDTDWANAPALVVKLDKPSGSTDDSFGQGSKEDSPNPTVVTGSIPPNKSDLSRFYVSHSVTNGNFFLNLAWERTNVLGSANMDFEFNKSTTIDTNGVTPVRSDGDILITFDFTNGGGNPVLGLLRWVTTGATSQCFSSNSLPCWGNRVNLSASGFAEGAVNSTTVTDPIPPNAPRQLSAGTFGEASINLTAANVFPAGQCVNFASAYLKSRSSAEFNSELKDFIAPANAQISNCGELRIHKMTDPSGSTTSFGYSTTGGLTPSSFSLTDGGTQDYKNIPAGNYTVTENDPTPAFDLTDLVCTSATGGSTTMTDLTSRKATVGLVASDTVDCTYTNRQRGTLIIKKLTTPSSDTTTSFPFTAGTGLSPSSFSLTNGNTETFTNVVPGSGFSVSETVPAHWNLTSATCDNGSGTLSSGTLSNISVAAGGTTTCTFNDQENGSITVTKVDDNGTPVALAGAVFTLFTDNAPLGGVRGPEDTSTGKNCTTDSTGTCTIPDVAPGRYWVVETTGVSGYDKAPDQNVLVTAGQNVPLTFTDPRQFTVITVVCQASNNQLYPSDITVDGQHKTSLDHNGGSTLTDAQICGIGGAHYDGKHFGDHPADVNIPQSHP